MRMRDLGEWGAVSRICQLLGIEMEDCARLPMGPDYLLVTTDMMAQSTDMPPGMSPWQAGWYLVAMNLSDIAAKGGRPLCLVASLGMPPDYGSDQLDDIITGMRTCAARFGTSIVGGDTNEQGELTLCGTGVGIVPQGEFMPRKGARVGDVVAVTGELGGAAAAFYSGKGKRLMEPWPRIAEGRALSKTHAITSSMDLSDGLAISLHQLCELNGVGFEVDWERMPMSKDVPGDEVRAREMVLYWGGDYELLVTIKPDKLQEAKGAASITPLGRVTPAGIVLLSGGKRMPIERRGYEHWSGGR